MPQAHNIGPPQINKDPTLAMETNGYLDHQEYQDHHWFANNPLISPLTLIPRVDQTMDPRTTLLQEMVDKVRESLVATPENRRVEGEITPTGEEIEITEEMKTGTEIKEDQDTRTTIVMNNTTEE